MKNLNKSTFPGHNLNHTGWSGGVVGEDIMYSIKKILVKYKDWVGEVVLADKSQEGKWATYRDIMNGGSFLVMIKSGEETITTSLTFREISYLEIKYDN